MVCLSFSRLQNSLFFPLNRFFKAPALCEIFVSRVEPGTPRTLLFLSSVLDRHKNGAVCILPILKSYEITTLNIVLTSHTYS